MKRTAPVAAPPKPVAAAAAPPKPKVNPFGAATAADTASKLQALDLKETKEPEKAAEPAAKEAEAPAAADAGREKSKARWEPKNVNSRAAAFEAAPTVKRDVSFSFCVNRADVFSVYDFTLTI